MWGWNRLNSGWWSFCGLQWVWFPCVSALLWVWEKGRNSTVSTVQDQIQTSQRYIYTSWWIKHSHPHKLVLVVRVIYFFVLIVFDVLKEVQGCREMKMRKILMILNMNSKLMTNKTRIETLLRPFSMVRWHSEEDQKTKILLSTLLSLLEYAHIRYEY